MRIVLSTGPSQRANEGALLGATQEQLAALWLECLPTDDPEPGFQQFG